MRKASNDVALVVVLLVLVELLLQEEDVDMVDLCQLHAQMKHLPQVSVGDRTFSIIW